MEIRNWIDAARQWAERWVMRLGRLWRREQPDAEVSVSAPEAGRRLPAVVVRADDPAIEMGGQAKPGLTEEALAYVRAHYEVRYNVLDRRAELRRRDEAGAPFRPLDELVRNTIVIALHRQGCIVWNADVERILSSLLMPQYHPFAAYMSALPAWDGTERVDALARRVADDALWVHIFHTWLRALAAQWAAAGSHDAAVTGNQMVPLLISERQGMRKSTFCRLLVPPELRAYYTDKFELAGRTNLELSLARFGLINLDEFDRYGERQMAKLKNLVQLGNMAGRRPYAAQFVQMERIASFIGTSNRADLLTDRTGSRRFFCQPVERVIDCDTPIDHARLFAQLAHECREGARTYFTPAEEAEIQLHNRAYYRVSVLHELFLRLFALPSAAPTGAGEGSGADGAEPGVWVGATQLFQEMHGRFGRLMTGETPLRLGRQLAILGVPSRHTRRGTQYRVVRRAEGAAEAGRGQAASGHVEAE